MTDSYTVQMLDGIATLLADSDAGVYRKTGTYVESERGIVFSVMPQSPTQAIAITRYLDMPGVLAINRVRVQVRSRVGQNPFEGESLVDLIRDTLHRKTNVSFGIVRFNLIEQESFTPLGPDDNGRFEYAQNFTLTGNRYSA